MIEPFCFLPKQNMTRRVFPPTCYIRSSSLSSESCSSKYVFLFMVTLVLFSICELTFLFLIFLIAYRGKRTKAPWKLRYLARTIAIPAKPSQAVQYSRFLSINGKWRRWLHGKTSLDRRWDGTQEEETFPLICTPKGEVHSMGFSLKGHWESRNLSLQFFLTHWPDM